MRWITCSAAEVPPGEGWLTDRERAVLAGLTVPPRREAWRLGRWTAKLLCGTDAEVLAADDGAPELTASDASLSLSHRAGLALAVTSRDAVVGCDLELVERRSSAFVEDWLAGPEREAVGGLAGDELALAVNLRWSAKEAAAKVRREGLRLDVRDAIATPAPGGEAGWAPLTVAWTTGGEVCGWWRIEGRWVLTVVSAPAGGPPRRAWNRS